MGGVEGGTMRIKCSGRRTKLMRKNLLAPAEVIVELLKASVRGGGGENRTSEKGIKIGVPNSIMQAGNE